MRTLKTCAIALLACMLLIGCSGPVFGQNVERFVEYEKEGVVPVPDGISTVLYVMRGYRPDAANPKNSVFLIVRDMADGAEKIIFEGSKSCFMCDWGTYKVSHPQGCILGDVTLYTSPSHT